MSAVESAMVEKIRSYLMSALAREMEAGFGYGNPRENVMSRLEEIYSTSRLQLDERWKQRIFEEVYDNLVGFGPIQPLLNDPMINEIMVNGYNHIYIERSGELLETGVHFENDMQVLQVINRMVYPLGRTVDADHPMVDARLPDGSRVNAIIPPASVDGPCITIRKFLQNHMTMEDLVRSGTLTEHMAEFLQACIVARLNMLISGPTSSGKTTFLNVLTGYIPGKQRIVTIEDAVELKLQQQHVIRLETRGPNSDGSGAVTTRDLVRNALRMRPDRIIVGEVRAGESFDMIQAMNTGHFGSLTTVHANTPRDALSRLETLAMMGGLDIPLLAIRRQIASAVNLVIHISRLNDGARKVTHITEVSGMEGDIITMSDLFKFEQTGVTPEGRVLGNMRATGLRPMFSQRLEVVGYKLRGEIFGPGKLLPGQR